ncbi:hypothetical protein [Ligilactobacillus salivarius]|uniref:hypothetical protein n=1 Tax=Ligilactobacillus salivarius TaxID=1624 RepID=UPI001651D76C|nr:hypothetical protein [Ligilactobacillus salivarius]MBC6925216.1 hypothetical protein [Ligilactobacillus salivarius]HIS19146.1 hypothetical protein [Candidatus Coprovivens excrementavium]
MYQDISQLIHDICSLAKKSKDLELKEKVFDLTNLVIDLRNENEDIREKLKLLEGSLKKVEENTEFAKKMKIDPKGDKFWLEGETVPYCLKCWDSEHKKIHMTLWEDMGIWSCPEHY